MLKKIDIRDLRLGMHIHGFEGSWLSHPFWKTRFVLSDTADLEAIRRSGVPACWIDLDKGFDIEIEVAPKPVVTAVPTAPDVELKEPSLAPASPKVDLASELQRAAATIERSREKVIVLFGEARMGRAVDTRQCVELVDDIADSVNRNPGALISLARLKTRDNYTYMHSIAVCGLMVSLARQLGQDEVRVREAGFAGLLHDIGKMAMPVAVLNKPGALTDEEFAVMKSHPARGHSILQDSSLAAPAALDVCMHHHEKLDGGGYPFKLAGAQITLLARMGAVCDVYDAITSTRPYKNAWDPAGSIQRMAQWKGHFDPMVFQTFVKCVGIYPVGSLVRLKSDRLAVVAEQAQNSLVSPTVKIFYSLKSKMPIPVETLDLSKPHCNDQIAARESPSDWGFTHLDELWQ